MKICSKAQTAAATAAIAATIVFSLNMAAVAQDASAQTEPAANQETPASAEAASAASAAPAASTPAKPAKPVARPKPQAAAAADDTIMLEDVVLTQGATAVSPPNRKPHGASSSVVNQPVNPVVTVRRQDEYIQSTPVSAKVFSGPQLGPGDRDSIERAAEGTPNMMFWSQGTISSPQLSIRGVGGLGGNAGIDRQQGIGFFIDDVFIARPTGYPTYFWDTERFEIARGSQAVLYGRNAIGGAVNIVTEKPVDIFSGFGSVTFGSDGLKRFTGAINVPVNNIVTTRAALTLTGRDGILYNEYDGSEVGDIRSGAGRFTTDIRPDSNTLVRISGDFGRDNTEGWAFGLASDVLNGKINVNERPIEHRDVGGGSLRIEHRFDSFKMTSISAYRGYRYDTQLDGDFLPLPVYSQGQWQDQDQFTQEIRFNGALSDRWLWTLGGFYLWEHLRGADQFDMYGVPPSLWSYNSLDQKTNSYSVFGELTYRATDRLDLIGGLRYTYETKEGTAAIATPSGTYAFGMPASASGSAEFDDVNPEFTARYRFTDDFMGYARASNGFRAGGISQYITPNGINIYDPETVWTYEIGAKTRWFDNRLFVDASVFYNDWKDQQVLQYILPRGRIIGNAGQSHTYGFEIEGSYRLSDSLRLSFGYGYLQARFDDYTDDVLGAVYSGNTIPLSPTNSVNVGIDHEQSIGYGMTMFAGMNYNYKGSYFFRADNLYAQDPVHLVNGRLGVRKGNWEAELWAKNLLDESYLAGYFSSSGMDLGAVADRRTVGVTLTSKF